MSLHQRLSALGPDDLRGLRRGLEKESLRVGRDGRLSAAPHPRALGAALSHPHITTDFSEAQLELITGVHTGVEPLLAELAQIHQAVQHALGDEMLWCASMPCGLPREADIPIGQYGTSNIGRAKTAYRNGLSHRYGRRMQMISGIHYNFSLPESAWQGLRAAFGNHADPVRVRNDGYFSLIRNFRRRSWLVLLLSGASPAVCSSFVEGRAHCLAPLSRGTLHMPYGTSLRMGPLGYQSEAQKSLRVSYNDLPSYARTLYRGLSGSYPPYEAIGLHDGHGHYRQLATSLLQIENEFYGTIRAKQPVQAGERPLRALGLRGVEYVEVRLLDLDPYAPIGVTAQTLRFIDVFLLVCLLADSPPDSEAESADNSHNQHATAERGRAPEATLLRNGREVLLRDRGREVLDECDPVAEALDAALGGSAYRDACHTARAMLENPETLGSARVLRDIVTTRGESYLDFVLERSRAHRKAILDLPLDADLVERYRRFAAESLAEQAAIEAADAVDFETFRRAYVAQDLMSGPYLQH